MLLFLSKICKHVSWLEGKQRVLDPQASSLWREGAALWKTSHMLWECSLEHLGSQREKHFAYWWAHGTHPTHVHTYSKIPYVFAFKQNLVLIIICQSQHILQVVKSASALVTHLAFTAMEECPTTNSTVAQSLFSGCGLFLSHSAIQWSAKDLLQFLGHWIFGTSDP